MTAAAQLLPLAGWDKQIVRHWLFLGSLYTVETEWRVKSQLYTQKKRTSFFYAEMLTWYNIYRSFGNIIPMTHTLKKYCKWTLSVQKNTFLP